MKDNRMKFLKAIIYLLAIFFVIGCSTTDHYKNGKEYLSVKKYPEAISEFQQVPADNKDFRLAQSKISYIQGMQAFNDSLFQAAEVQLVKVAAEDEYYREALLMLDKIQQRRNLTEASGKDTVIIKQEITDLRSKESKGTIKATEVTDVEVTRKFVSQMSTSIGSFESLYQSAHTASVDSKKNYLANMQSALRNFNALDYIAKERSADALELKKRASAWMSKRIEFISMLINDNTVQETNNSRSMKEEGDKMYYGVTTLLNKVK